MTSTLPEAPPNLKLLLIGNSSVGKSSLLTRFTDASFTPEDESSDVKRLEGDSPTGRETTPNTKL